MPHSELQLDIPLGSRHDVRVYSPNLLVIPMATEKTTTQSKAEFTRCLVIQVEKMVKESGEIEGFDAEKWVGDWLQHPIPALGDKKPEELMGTTDGQDIISRILAQVQSGAYA